MNNKLPKNQLFYSLYKKYNNNELYLFYYSKLNTIIPLNEYAPYKEEYIHYIIDNEIFFKKYMNDILKLNIKFNLILKLNNLNLLEKLILQYKNDIQELNNKISYEPIKSLNLVDIHS